MNTKCKTCGAPQNTTDSQECSYCGSIIQESIECSFGELSEFNLAFFEYNKGNFYKSHQLFDELLKKYPDSFIAWMYKICSNFRTMFPSKLVKKYINYEGFEEFQKDISYLLGISKNPQNLKLLQDTILKNIEEVISQQYYYNNSNYDDDDSE
jgi:hypothetical protein